MAKRKVTAAEFLHAADCLRDFHQDCLDYYQNDPDFKTRDELEQHFAWLRQDAEHLEQLAADQQP